MAERLPDGLYVDKYGDPVEIESGIVGAHVSNFYKQQDFDLTGIERLYPASLVDRMAAALERAKAAISGDVGPRGADFISEVLAEYDRMRGGS